MIKNYLDARIDSQNTFYSKIRLDELLQYLDLIFLYII
jgi:hypothetical protein